MFINKIRLSIYFVMACLPNLAWASDIHWFIDTPGTGPTSSCGTYPQAVSADGTTVVGYSDYSQGYAYTYRSFKWTRETGFSLLATPAGYDQARAYTVSHDGSIISGRADSTGLGPLIARWDAAGSPSIIGLSGPVSWHYALAGTSDGQMLVGQAGVWTLQSAKPVLWTAADGFRILGEPVGGVVPNGTAYGISADG